jgi:site-specific recombinase XerD
MDITSLVEQFCQYSLTMRGYLPDTITKYRTVLKVFLNATNVSATTECTDIVVRDFFYRGRMERGWKASTFMTYRNTLAVFFRWCVNQRHLPASPIDGLERPKLRRSLPRRLTSQDAERLLERISNYPYRSRLERCRDLALVATTLYAGLRKSELIRLTLADVEAESRSLFVRFGKGGKDRVIPMGPSLADILAAYLIERKKAGKCCSNFFVSLRHDRGLTIQGLRSLTLKLRRITGMVFSPHMLRHTFATLMLEGGCDIFALSRLMGHSDINTTTIYLAASAQHLRAQMARHPLDHSGELYFSQPG